MTAYKSLFLLLSLLLCLRFFLFFMLGPHPTKGELLHFSTILVDDGLVTHGVQQLSVMYSNGWGVLPLQLQIARKEPLTYGQEITITGTYDTQLLKNGKTVHTINSKDIVVTEKTNIFLLPLRVLRDHAFAAYFTYLPDTHAKLLAGIVLGKRFLFDTSFQHAMRLSGVTHVIAASGMNVTFTIVVLFQIFSVLVRRKRAVVGSICAVVCYVFLSGCGASIVRAGIMGIGDLLARLLGRQRIGIYWLFLCVYSMLFLSPQLVWDSGFQLSVLATLGLFSLKPLMPGGGIWEDVTTTISAQIMTLPILLTTFHTIGLLSVLVNGLVLWMIAPLMIVGALSAILSLIWLPLAAVVAYTVYPLLWLFVKIVTFFGELPVGLTLTDMPLVTIVGYYLLVGSILWILWQRKWSQRHVLSDSI